MELKKFQRNVLNDLQKFFDELNKGKGITDAYNCYWENKNVNVGFNSIKPYNNIIKNVPRICFKVPTGGGKTFLACNSIKIIFDNLPAIKSKVVLWLVPSEAILTQTLNNLKNPNHDYRRKLESDFNGRVVVLNKDEALNGQQFNPTSVNEQLTIIVLSFDSFRTTDKDGRRVYRENGNLQLFTKLNNNVNSFRIKDAEDSSLAQVLNNLSPVVIVDESHHTEGDLSIEMLNNLNPSFILDLTATPRDNSNIISFVDASQLKKENMVKLPVIVYNRPTTEEVIVDAIDLRNRLENESIIEEKNSGYYNRPIILFQAQPKAKENKETFEKLKSKLIGFGISPDEIAIKTAEINEIKNIDLMSKECKIRYIITVNALKEGWDCPFAYILATLANKTSSVDVEQILGRILRLPYTRQNSCKFLNLSYVLTSSVDFNNTLQKIIIGLNDAGYSSKDYRVANIQKEENKVNYIQQELNSNVNDTDLSEREKQEAEEFLNFNENEVKNILESRQKENNNTTVEDMLQGAEDKNNAYEASLELGDESDPELNSLSLEVRNSMNVIDMYANFEKDALDIKFPQFYIKGKITLFSDNDSILLNKDELADGFTLVDKDIEINFDSLNDDVATIDIDRDDSPKYKLLSSQEVDYFKSFFESLPPESRKRNCKLIIKRNLEKINYIDGQDLSKYIDRIVENMDSDTLVSMEKNILKYTEKIKQKIEKLVNGYIKDKFYKYIEIGKITCEPSYSLKKTISPLNTFDMLSKSLYTKEEAMGKFENKIISKVSSLPNVIWWHRNISKTGFVINGFINHYPDFIIYTKSGNVILLETKGVQLVDNSDSKDKAELGKKWQAMAGGKFKYYMVYEDSPKDNTNAITYDDFINILKQL